MRKTGLAAALAAGGSLAVAFVAFVACSDDPAEQDTGAAVEPEPPRHGLTPEQAAEPLVTIGERTITVGELADRLADQSPYLRARYNSPERRREFLDNMIRFELLAQEARRRGFEDLPEIARSRKQMSIQQMMKRDFEDRIPLSSVTDEEIRAYYDAHADEFNKPEQIRASHIVVKNRGAAERILRQLIARPSDIELFREMAEQHNEDTETRDRLGDLRFFSRPAERGDDEPAVPDAVAEAAFSITEIGGVHPHLVETPAGFHIVKLTGRRAALRRTLEEARRPIQNRLWREKRERAVEELVLRLRREANIEEHLDRLADVRIDAPEGGTPTETPLLEHAPVLPRPPAAPQGAP